MLSTEKLDELEKLSSVFFSIRECAIIMELDYHSLKSAIQNEETAEHKKYYKGCLESEFLLRKNTIDYANRGSSKAQQDSFKLIEKMKSKNS